MALIGTGGWGREHALIFRQRPDVHFVAVCGRDASRTAKRAAEYEVRPYTDIDTMLEKEQPGLVSLCLPNREHYEATYAYPNTHTVEVSGTKGRLLIEDTVRRHTFSAHQSETAEVWQAGYFNDTDRSFYQTFDKHMDAMFAAFKAREQPPVHAIAGRRALELAMASIESFQTGRRVPASVNSFRPSAPAPVTAPPPTP